MRAHQTCFYFFCITFILFFQHIIHLCKYFVSNIDNGNLRYFLTVFSSFIFLLDSLEFTIESDGYGETERLHQRLIFFVVILWGKLEWFTCHGFRKMKKNNSLWKILSTILLQKKLNKMNQDNSSKKRETSFS